ncbi:alpha-2-macroglobulin domain protein [Pelobacter propionicus DSM 2379]|uniref:Alpha-2-macroglobulin domain protein n=2 Tax=Pelobacter propionicus TaxID=29543 RepID=A1ANK0_PELPD|nr:alpha-2-macroglobulin domain protein [Pelobacter propionicus DSM 2379]
MASSPASSGLSDSLPTTKESLMKTIRILFTLLIMTLIPAAAWAARGKPPQTAKQVSVSGTIISAETNRPVKGATITFMENRGMKVPLTSAATATSDSEGRFNVDLKPGYYTWLVRKDGYGLFEGGASVSSRQTETLSAYLHRQAELSGRLVDGGGRPMPGVRIVASRWVGSVSGSDGRFTITGLDSQGYEPRLQHPGWVLEKSAYIQLDPAEKKDLGDLVMRRAATLSVTVIPRNGAGRPLERINLSFSGDSLYRSATTAGRSVAVFNDLPPGDYSLFPSDERLNGTREVVRLQEGEQRTLTLRPEVKPPWLTIEEYGDVFLPDRALKLRTHGLWVEKAEAVISAIDSAPLLTGKVDLRQPDGIPTGYLHKLTSYPLTFPARRYGHSRSAHVPIPGLKPGAYLLELKGSGATARFGFLVTRLGLVAKTSPKGTQLYATDLVSGRALAGVTIGSTQSGTQATSDANGMATWDTTGSARTLTGRLGDSLAFLELGSGETQAATTRGYLYSDRPAYRPGQTVYYKGVLRQRGDGDAYTLPKLDRIHVTISDSGDKTVCEHDAPLSSGASFQGECALARGASLGGYTINASAGNESWQGWFRVLEYRKPEFELQLTPDRRFLVTGETAQVRLSGRYYFGAPLADARVNWRIYSRPAAELGRDSDGYDDEERSSGGYADFIGEGELRLDDKGEALIPVAAKSHDMPHSYTLEVDVTDASSRQVSSSSSLTVVPSLVALKVTTSSYLTKPGQAVEVSLSAADWEGNPRAVPLNLAFEQQIYDGKSRSHSWKRSGSVSLTTDVSGRAQTSYRFPHPGLWRVRGRAADQAGRTSTADALIWVWKEGDDWQGPQRDLEAEFDQKTYKPGDTARLIVRTPGSGGTLLLTLEGREIHNSRTIVLKNNLQVVEIPVSESYAPFMHVSAVTVRGGRFFSRTLPLRVDIQPGKLDIRVRADKPVYAPGDRVRLTISPTAEGKQVPAELSLAVVDEAIFAVAPERGDDIYRFFRGNREHLVTTLHSFPRVYLGGAAKDGAALTAQDDGLKGVKSRKTFKDTALWQPMLTTNADGSATAEFTLPDNLTTWRATAVGQTLSSDFGTGREKFIARLGLMARLSPPRFLTVGDELKIPGLLTSMADRQQTVRGRFEASGLTLLKGTDFSGELAPRGTLRRDMALKAERAGNATLKLMARGEQGADAMELTLPVLERGIPRTAATGIALRERQGDETLTLPDNALPGSGELKISFSPTIAASLDSAISRLVQFPYGCVEQTLSRFIPALHARALLSQQGWQPDPATQEKLASAIDQGMKRLEEMQHADGGWGWWERDSSSLTMTSHALYALGLAKRAGLPIPPGMVQRGTQALESLLRNAPAGDQARAFRAFAVNAIDKEELEQRIRLEWGELTTADQLAFCQGLAFAGRNDALPPLLDELKRNIRHEGTAAYIQDRDADSWWYGWRWGSSAVETTSGLLSLVVKQNPADPLAARLAEFLARRQSGGWWRTTTSSAAAVVALADYVAASGESTASYSATLAVNGKKLADYRVEKGRLVAGERQLCITAAALKSGNNTLKLTKDDGGAAYLAATLEYAVPPEAVQSSPGLKITRSMYRINSVKTQEGWRRELTPLAADQPVSPGDDIEVRLTVDNDRALEYVIIEDRLPAGFESREADRDPRFRDETAFFDWYAHRERRDERMAFFVTSLPAGRHEFRHVIYPELEGRITALPAVVWPMYQPELRGESRAWKVEVRGR